MRHCGVGLQSAMYLVTMMHDGYEMSGTVNYSGRRFLVVVARPTVASEVHGLFVKVDSQNVTRFWGLALRDCQTVTQHSSY